VPRTAQVRWSVDLKERDGRRPVAPPGTRYGASCCCRAADAINQDATEQRVSLEMANPGSAPRTFIYYVARLFSTLYIISILPTCPTNEETMQMVEIAREMNIVRSPTDETVSSHLQTRFITENNVRRTNIQGKKVYGRPEQCFFIWIGY